MAPQSVSSPRQDRPGAISSSAAARPSAVTPGERRREQRIVALWGAFTVLGFVLLELVQDELSYGIVIGSLAALLALPSARLAPHLPWARATIDRGDLAAVVSFYAAIVALLTLAFQFFTTERTAGLFIAFAGALIVGVVGPVLYTARRGRPLSSLGLGRHNLRSTIAFGLALAAVQFALTLYGYELPSSAEDWVPLLGMALVVGLFESVFFRGFVQSRLEASFGMIGAVALSSLLYALYHVGYGMALEQMAFLFGLGIVYAVAYRLVNNILVLWPLLTPLGSFYANLVAGDIELPWASLLGFADVLALMVAALVIANRRAARRTSPGPPPTRT